MSEEVVQETVAPTVEENSGPSNSLEDVDDPKVLKKLIKELRAENAGARSKNKDVESKLSEYDKWKASQQSELERTVSENEKLQKKNRELIRKSLVTTYKVPENLADFVDGATEDEMEEKAKRLGATNVATGLQPTDGNAMLFGGDRGRPVGKVDDAGHNASGLGGQFLKEMYEKNGRVN